MKIVEVPIEDLKPAKYNPRKWSEKAIEDLKKSIEKFGLVDPLIVNLASNRKNIVIGGHFRLYAAKQLGYKKVPVVYVNIPDEQKERELNLRLNKNLGEWDWDLLAEFDEDLLKDVGFNDAEIEKIFFGLEKSIYVQELKTPIYQPEGRKVEIKDLVDDSKIKEFLKKIEELDCDGELRQFLIYAAYRHLKFNYENIAEFYVQLKDKRIKKIFEELALVIIDSKRALELGYLRLMNELLEMIKDEE